MVYIFIYLQLLPWLEEVIHHVEKSTLKDSKLNAVNEQQSQSDSKVCSILDPDCEACQ